MSKTLYAWFAATGTAVAGLIVSNTIAGGFTDCDNAVGPDVIVGEITGPSNYSAVGSVEAFAIGTTS